MLLARGKMYHVAVPMWSEANGRIVWRRALGEVIFDEGKYLWFTRVYLSNGQARIVDPKGADTEKEALHHLGLMVKNWSICEENKLWGKAAKVRRGKATVTAKKADALSDLFEEPGDCGDGGHGDI